MSVAPIAEHDVSPRRDPFGLTPLYHSNDHLGTSLHEFVLAAPHDAALVEYVGLGEVWDQAATFLEGVDRVPPGFEVRRGELVRWFEPPHPEFTELTGYRLIDTFWRRFGDAVERSVGGNDIVVSLSGGLDSAAMAAAAVERFGPSRVSALTIGHESDFEDPEPLFARRTATYLGIDWRFVNADHADIAVDWIDTPIWPNEPVSETAREWEAAIPRDAVVLWGLGGDSILRGDRQHYARRLGAGELREAASDAVRTMLLHGRRPAFGTSRLFSTDNVRYERPAWLRPSRHWDAAVQLRQTLDWERGIDELMAPAWSYCFESNHRANLPEAPDYRYPFFDLEFATFMASVPTAPWCVDKEILRAALRGKVPEAVRLREKTPVTGEAIVQISEEAFGWFRDALESGSADRFVDRGQVLDGLRPGTRPHSEVVPFLRAAAAARWLARLT